MPEQIEAVERYLKDQGLKLTRPRRRVVEKILSVKGHVTADELIDQLRKGGTPVSRATVYRTLSVVADSGLIDGHDFEKGKRLYEPMVGRAHHDHLYCMGCGKVIEFQEEAIERLQDMVVQRYHFAPVYHSHKIFGYCQKCTAKGLPPPAHPIPRVTP